MIEEYTTTLACSPEAPSGPVSSKVFERKGHLYFYDGVSEESILKLIELSDQVIKCDWQGKKPNYHLHICSPGGDVTAMTIFQDYLEGFVFPNTDNPTVYIEGQAASAAAVISVMFPNRVIGSRANLMLHEVQAFSGTWRCYTHIKTHDAKLDHITKLMYDTYEKHSKLSRAQIEDICLKEKYIYAEEAIELGLADKIQYR